MMNKMYHSNHKFSVSPPPSMRKRTAIKSGFTLVELLVVMAIIAIISGFVITAVSGDDGVQALNSGVSRANGVFSLARSAAIQRKTPTRVLIHADPADPERFLRYMMILYWNDAANPPAWEAYAEGETLPRGVAFSPGLSSHSSGEYPDLRTWRVGIDNNFNVNVLNEPTAQSNYNPTLPVDTVEGAGANTWFVYDFRSNGTAAHPLSRFVLARAIVSTDPVRIQGITYEESAGFILFRGGKAVHFQDWTQIGEN